MEGRKWVEWCYNFWWYNPLPFLPSAATFPICPCQELKGGGRCWVAVPPPPSLPLAFSCLAGGLGKVAIGMTSFSPPSLLLPFSYPTTVVCVFLLPMGANIVFCFSSRSDIILHVIQYASTWPHPSDTHNPRHDLTEHSNTMSSPICTS